MLCFATIGVFGFVNGQKKKQAAYDAAVALLEENKYEDAIAAFAALGNFKDANVQMVAAQEEGYTLASNLLNEKKYKDAEIIFASLGEYKDCKKKAEEAKQIPMELYQKADKLCEDGMYDEAYFIFKELGSYKDAGQRMKDFLMLPSTLEIENKNGSSVCKYTYDLDGNLVKFRQENDTYFSENTYIYDEKGRLTKSVEHEEYFDKNATYSYAKSDITTEYTYDEHGNLIQADKTKKGNISYSHWTPTTKYEYNEKNQQTKMTVQVAGQRNPDVAQFYYDEEGRQILSTWDYKDLYLGDGYGNVHHNVEQVSREYDENGYATKEVYTFAEGEYIINLSRDSEGRVLTMVEVDVEGNTSEMVNSYDENGNLLQKTVTESDGSVITTLYNYDVDNHMTKMVTTYADGEKTIIAYTYDEDGNMLTKSVRDKNGDTACRYSDYLIFFRPGKNNNQNDYFRRESRYYVS